MKMINNQLEIIYNRNWVYSGVHTLARKRRKLCPHMFSRVIRWSKAYWWIYVILKLFSALLGIILLMILFKDCENEVSLSTKKGYCLQYIGRHTLDIYFLHFFFLPYNMAFVGEWLEKNPNPLLEFCMSLTLALIVILCCLIVSKIIRLSPTLAYLLLGAKHIKQI